MRFTGLTLILACALISESASTQLLQNPQLYPGESVVTHFQYNGSAKGRYYQKKFINENGEIHQQAWFKNDVLLQVTQFRYNQQHDVIFEQEIFSVNSLKGRAPTIYEYDYRSDGIISWQRSWKEGSTDTSGYRLVEELADGRLVYDEYNTVGSWKQVLRYDDSFRLLLQEWEVPGEYTSTNTYSYNERGQIASRKIEKVYEDPTSAKARFGSVYVGGPGGDYMTYTYKYDREGRIKKTWLTVNGKRYKVGKTVYGLMPNERASLSEWREVYLPERE